MLLKYFPCLPSPFHSQIHCCPLGLCNCSFELLKYLPTDVTFPRLLPCQSPLCFAAWVIFL